MAAAVGNHNAAGPHRSKGRSAGTKTKVHKVGVKRTKAPKMAKVPKVKIPKVKGMKAQKTAVPQMNLTPLASWNPWIVQQTTTM